MMLTISFLKLLNEYNGAMKTLYSKFNKTYLWYDYLWMKMIWQPLTMSKQTDIYIFMQIIFALQTENDLLELRQYKIKWNKYNK